MAYIRFDNVSVEIPVFNASARSLKKALISVATGGQLGSSEGHVVVRALNDICFEVKDGDRVALLGHNGAGKSTFLRLLSGVYAPTSGAAEIKGEVSSLIDVSLGIDPEATGRENIFIRASLLGMKASEIRSHIDDIVEFSGLGDFINMPVRTYSSGMHLRLAFSVSTILQPEILLMDEWLSVGDEDFRHKAEARMNSLISSTRILVIATHSRDLAMSVCNRAILLEHGKIVMDADPEKVCTTYFSPKL
ncbi:ABC transporter ATP-binding protein [Pseudomonas sp. NPDC047961]